MADFKWNCKCSPLLTCSWCHNHIHSVMTASCVGAAAAGCLGSGCDWRYLRGCQQQIQADGLWMRQVSTFSCDGKETCACVCSKIVAHVVCVSSVRTCQFLFAKTCLVCACVIRQVGRNVSCSLSSLSFFALCFSVCTSLSYDLAQFLIFFSFFF